MKEDHTMIRQCILGVGLLLLVSQAPAQKPSFEVSSVKRNMSGLAGGTIGPKGDRFLATNLTLMNLLMYAYAPPNGRFLKAQIVGGPDWANTDHFDIQAKPEGNAPILPNEETKAMLQSLLEDRFQLKAHRETRDLPVYDLILIKGGPKLSADQTPPDPRQGFINFISSGDPVQPLPRGAMRIITGPSGTTLNGTAVSISKLMSLLQGRSDRIIVDKTGFNGLLDFHLEFSELELRQDPGAAARDAADPALPSLFTAVEEIGLKLESAKAHLEVLVIDSAQKPSED
jgi:uncharacterized protein (TIGR03435 family)